jgi:SWI/SNF-related matrix-associated actin-dependent regulator of chromatin subfamily A member 5
MRVVSSYGDLEERTKQFKKFLRPKQFDVVITTFEMLKIEKTKFKKFQFEFIVVDEAHRLKNDESILSQTVREIDSSFRLLITGTPLQNNLKELWALLNFLIPDIFADASLFEDFFP